MIKSDEINKIKEQFHYFNINTEVDSIYGEWAVSSKGDVVNSLYPFVIFSFKLHDCDWIQVIRERIWFEQESEQNFLKAMERADKIINN